MFCDIVDFFSADQHAVDGGQAVAAGGCGCHQGQAADEILVIDLVIVEEEVADFPDFFTCQGTVRYFF